MSANFIARKNSSDKTEAIRVVDEQGRSSEADVNQQGNLSHSITGKSPRGREGEDVVSGLLVEHLNKNKEGEKWRTPIRVEHEHGVDYETTDGRDKLEIQVTRLPDESMWMKLGRTGTFSKNTTIEKAADDLREAIRHKESIPARQRSTLTVAIDAMDTSGHAVPAVATVFRQRYGAEVQRLGFQSIWVVGPIVDLVEQLDH